MEGAIQDNLHLDEIVDSIDHLGSVLQGFELTKAFLSLLLQDPPHLQMPGGNGS